MLKLQMLTFLTVISFISCSSSDDSESNPDATIKFADSKVAAICV